MKQARHLILILLTFITADLQAQEFRLADIDALIAAKSEPDGVVFEIITWEDNTWDWAAPKLKVLIEQLRTTYPGLEVALISHGNELFDLALEKNNQSQPAIKTLQNLSEDDVDIYVCGTYASYKHLGIYDFLPFVDVAPSGTAQLNDYIKLGFEHIVLERSNAVN